MWAEQKPNGKYIFRERYTDPMTGKQKIVSVTMDKNTVASRKKAEAVLITKILDKSSLSVSSSRLTLKELADLYITHKKSTTRPNTYERDRYAINAILRILGENTLVCKLQAGYIRQRFLETDQSPGWKNENLVRLKTFLRWGYKNDYIDDISYLMKLDPFNDIPHRAKIEDKYMESSEVHSLLEHMKVEKWKDLTEFLALSGLRIGEALALSIHDVDLSDRLIHVTKTLLIKTGQIQESPKTETSNRDIYIQDELLPLIQRIRKAALPYCMINNSTLLFQDEHGPYKYAAYNKYLKTHTQQTLGRTLTPHALRHTHTSLMAEQEISLETIARRLGHSNSRITREIYFHVTKKIKEKDQEAVKNIKIL